MTTTVARIWALPAAEAWCLQPTLSALFDIHPATSMAGVARVLSRLPAVEIDFILRCAEVFGAKWDVDSIRAELPSLTEKETKRVLCALRTKVDNLDDTTNLEACA